MSQAKISLPTFSRKVECAARVRTRQCVCVCVSSEGQFLTLLARRHYANGPRVGGPVIHITDGCVTD